MNTALAISSTGDTVATDNVMIEERLTLRWGDVCGIISCSVELLVRKRYCLMIKDMIL